MAAVFLAYLPVCWAGYIWDDDITLFTNPTIVGPLGLKQIWTTAAADICPMTLSTFWVEHKLWGLAPLPYHLVNVFMQAASAALLWRVLRRLAVPGAWLGAALWALHPVEVESVAWIVEMKNTESGLFFLLAILFYLRGLPRRTAANYGLTLLFSALAIASKSSTVILPLVLLLGAGWIEKRWRWRTCLEVAPVFLFSLLAGLVSIWTQRLSGAADPRWVRSWPEKLVTAGDAVWFYLGKLLWPRPLITIYPRWQIDPAAWGSWLPLLAVPLLLAVLWLNRKSWGRAPLFAFAYFLIALAPALGLINMSFFPNSFVADHFQYLAGMGPLALLAAGLHRLSDKFDATPSLVPAGLAAGLLLVLGVVTWQRCWVYRDQEALWTDALAKNPASFAAYNNLGNALFAQGRAAEALQNYRKALALNPVDSEAYNNIGTILFKSGHPREALAQYQKALETRPDSAQAHFNVGNVLIQLGRRDEGAAELETAVRLNPGLFNARNNLAVVLYNMGRIDEAADQLQESLAYDPDDANLRNNLGFVLLHQGDVNGALAQYQKAAQLNPGSADIQNNLGLAYVKLGDLDEAAACFQQAVRLQPGFAAATRNLALAQAKLRQKNGAHP